jgi:hypothetical protein
MTQITREGFLRLLGEADCCRQLWAAFPEAGGDRLREVRELGLQAYNLASEDDCDPRRPDKEAALDAFYNACGDIGAIGQVKQNEGVYIRPVDEDALPTGPRIYIREAQG